MTGTIRKTSRFELAQDARGNVTIRRFSDGKFVFVDDQRAGQIIARQTDIIMMPHAAFDVLMTNDMMQVSA